MQHARPHVLVLLGLLCALLPSRSAAATAHVPAPLVAPQPAAPQPPDSTAATAANVDPTGHWLEYDTSTVTVRWQSAQPTAGWLLYGDQPETLTQVAYDPTLGSAPGAEHAVVLPLIPGLPLFYMPVIDGAPLRKFGAPWVIEAPPAPRPDLRTTEPRTLYDALLDVSLTVPAGWQVSPTVVDPEVEPLLQLAAADGGWIAISRVPQSAATDGLTPESPIQALWGEVSPSGVVELPGGSSIYLTQRASCNQAALIDLVMATPGAPLRVSYLAPFGSGAANSGLIAPLRELLATLQSGPAPATPGDLALYTAVATLPTPEPCTTSEEPAPHDAQGMQLAPSGAARCAGAPMFVPVVSPSVGPWNCQNDAYYCSPYFSNSTDPYFTKPHRGLDLRGAEGQTPVFAPYSGTLYRWGAGSMRLIFDAPYAGMSAYFAHMASHDGKRDYRVARSGARAVAGATLLGYTGVYGTGAHNPHVHIAWCANDDGVEGAWPTMDPTPFLGARSLVFYPGWSASGSPVTCAADRADAFEPDSFVSAARALVVDGAPQRHDFHAPNDEDWVSVELRAGTVYRFFTAALEANSDTHLSLFNAAGTVQLAANDDDGSPASRLDWTPAASGRYLLRLRHSSWRGYTYEPGGRARYQPPVYGAGTGYLLYATTNLLLGRPAFVYTNPALTSTTAPALAVDGDPATLWLGGCPVGSSTNGTRAHWLEVNAGAGPISELLIRWGDRRPASFLLGWRGTDGRTLVQRYESGAAVQRFSWPVQPAAAIVLIVESLPLGEPTGAPMAGASAACSVQIRELAAGQTLQLPADAPSTVTQPSSGLFAVHWLNSMGLTHTFFPTAHNTR